VVLEPSCGRQQPVCQQAGGILAGWRQPGRSVGGQWPVGVVAWWRLGGTAGEPVLLVYHDVEKPSTGYGFRVPKFQLSLMLYLSQSCLQSLSKVSDSQSSRSLRLCTSHHFGSSRKTIFNGNI
jgi:hypothetical protein